MVGQELPQVDGQWTLGKELLIFAQCSSEYWAKNILASCAREALLVVEAGLAPHHVHQEDLVPAPGLPPRSPLCLPSHSPQASSLVPTAGLHLGLLSKLAPSPRTKVATVAGGAVDLIS